MSSNHPQWSDEVKCGICSRLLLPLTFRRSFVNDGSRYAASRPDLKCPACGQRLPVARLDALGADAPRPCTPPGAALARTGTHRGISGLKSARLTCRPSDIDGDLSAEKDERPEQDREKR
jgi:hypothetical protein